MSHNILVPLAEGFEELEAITLTDTLHRAGCRVVTASCGESRTLTAAHGAVMQTQESLAELVDTDWSLIALPGGMPGAEHLRDSDLLVRLLKRQKEQHQWIAAICAAPALVLAHHDLLGAARATCYPAFLHLLPEQARDAGAPCVIDQQEKIATSQGPGTALPFALELVALLFDRKKAQEVAGDMLVSFPAS
ncbi:MAG: DJ-1/PfpI family protein [Kistimonas sp.]|nr:DJ-1/PfpI family protein [Kistimonas sp.]